MLKKPLYFYTFDYDDYMMNRDVYIDFKKYVPGAVAGDARSLMEQIERGETDMKKLEQFRDLMISRPRSNSYTEDIADFFEEILKENK